MNALDFVTVPTHLLDAVADGWYYSPQDILGPHLGDESITVRTLRRLADKVFIETSEGRTEAVHEHRGIWRAVLPGTDTFDYRVVSVYGGVEHRSDDPYRFLPTVGEMDIYLFNEGRHEKLWKALGSHVRSFPSKLGTVQALRYGHPTPRLCA